MPVTQLCVLEEQRKINASINIPEYTVARVYFGHGNHVVDDVWVQLLCNFLNTTWERA